MEIAVLIEPVEGNGFRARGVELASLSAEGPTREAALEYQRKLLQDKVCGGSQIVSVDTAASEPPLRLVAGICDPEDTLMAGWKATMTANRRQADLDPDLPRVFVFWTPISSRFARKTILL